MGCHLGYYAAEVFGPDEAFSWAPVVPLGHQFTVVPYGARQQENYQPSA
jgi:hypothetical protein